MKSIITGVNARTKSYHIIDSIHENFLRFIGTHWTHRQRPMRHIFNHPGNRIAANRSIDVKVQWHFHMIPGLSVHQSKQYRRGVDLIQKFVLRIETDLIHRQVRRVHSDTGKYDTPRYLPIYVNSFIDIFPLAIAL